MLTEAMGIVLAPSDQQDVDDQVSLAREAIGDDEFAIAWEAGRAMSMEEAVAFAMEAIS